MSILRSIAIVLYLVAVASPAPAKGTGGCDAFTWNVAHELELMQAPAQRIEANTNIQQSAMPLELDRHYAIELHPQGTVGYVVAPAREARDADPQGGIAYFHVEESGRYRIALDTGHWIDVIDAGSNVLDPSKATVMPSVAHEGQSECAALRKIVAFDLQGGITYRLHFSGRNAKRVGVAVTRGGKD